LSAETDLIEHLKAITGQDELLLAKITDEVRAWYGKDLATWIRARHDALQRQGLRNQEIFPRLQAEAKQTLVRPDELSERQIRRLVYG
jgi:hypothetical protein